MRMIPTPLPSVVHMIIRRPCRYLCVWRILTVSSIMMRIILTDILQIKKGDIDLMWFASIITQDDPDRHCGPVRDSMGTSMMWLMCAFSVFTLCLVIYLLAKMIVEKNEQSISMIKILGYSDKEAGSLYNRATGVVLVISLLLVIPICPFTMMAIYYVMMQQFNGWLTYYVAPWVYPAMIAIGIVCYLVVHDTDEAHTESRWDVH